MDNIPTTNKVTLIKNIYFYLVSFVALMMVVFSVADAVNIALKTYVFTKADNFNNYYYPTPACDPGLVKGGDPSVRPLTPEECAKQEQTGRQRMEDERIGQRQRDVVRDISFVVVGLPLFILHWMVVRKKEV